MELETVYMKPDSLKDYERARKQSSVYFCRRRSEEGIDVVHASAVWLESLPLLQAVALDSAPREENGPRADENDWERIIYSIKIVKELTQEELTALQTGSSTSGYGPKALLPFCDVEFKNKNPQQFRLYSIFIDVLSEQGFLLQIHLILRC